MYYVKNKHGISKATGADIQHISSGGAGSTGRGVLFWYAKIHMSADIGADGMYGRLLPIEYKPASENTLTRSDQGRQAVVGRGA